MLGRFAAPIRMLLVARPPIKSRAKSVGIVRLRRGKCQCSIQTRLPIILRATYGN